MLIIFQSYIKTA